MFLASLLAGSLGAAILWPRAAEQKGSISCTIEVLSGCVDASDAIANPPKAALK
ncbi:protein of unknown function [Candidatus Nitrotoga arctica]|uniref:Uncharacterized protein n=1 Tax=Candidatus Nitrotoga arctica TaxID=453162 RepID=A0ABM8Z0F8_9PROT|nr:protein of unknown function [Candidatus Nitrotoga arctica]